MENKIRKIASLTAGILSALGLFYSATAEVWHLPFAEEITAQTGILVQLISAVLATFTAGSVGDYLAAEKKSAEFAEFISNAKSEPASEEPAGVLDEFGNVRKIND